MNQIRKRLTYANVMSSIAVFLVLGGATAIAAKKIGTKQLKANSVTTGKIKKNAVTTAKIKNNAVTGAKVNESTLGAVPLANNLSYMTQLKLTKAASSATGATDAAGAAAATPVTLYDDSHFTVYGKCYVDSSGPFLRARVYIATKQDGAIFDSDDDELDGAAPDGYLNIGTTESVREMMNVLATANSAEIQYEGDTEFGATAADGYTIQGDVPIAAKFGIPVAGDGPYGPGDVCLFGISVAHS
ncbi:MAG TPA: hypothetical protein VNM89_05350 [Solirubrobacterales bacterium]|nr:hypothetical protein [Solirubrobacterales bacterium]